MPLIECPECEAQVSSKAEACPHCGYPITSAEAEAAERAEQWRDFCTRYLNATTKQREEMWAALTPEQERELMVTWRELGLDRKGSPHPSRLPPSEAQREYQRKHLMTCGIVVAITVISILLAFGMWTDAEMQVDDSPEPTRASSPQPPSPTFEPVTVVTLDDRARLCPQPACGQNMEITRIPTGTELLPTDSETIEHSEILSTTYYKVNYGAETGWISEHNVE